MASLSWLIFISHTILSAQCFFHYFPLEKLSVGKADRGDVGEPLFLTPFIEGGHIAEGRNRARVQLDQSLDIDSYAGYFTVNKTYNSNLFFWYFPSIVEDKKTAPVLLWLQGGPGGSSLFGLFDENGPIRVRNNTFERRKHNWALNHHIIYIDNPVGTGFSFTKNEKGYCTEETQIGEQLYSSLTQFFQLFPELKQNKFFITGESYAGKYIPAIAYAIHKKNPTAETKINLQGLAIGDGWCDPEHQLVYSKYLYQIGLIDWNAKKVMQTHEAQTVNYIKSKDWDNANKQWSIVLSPITEINLYNYITENTVKPEDNYINMIPKITVRKAIHVGNQTYSTGFQVSHYLSQDLMQSVAPWISELLDHYPVVMYSGQLDIIVAYPLTVNFLRNLKFTGSEEYKTAERREWRVDGEIAGFVKRAGRLTEILVRNAGHMVPTDQPAWSCDMITRITHGIDFHDKH